MTSIFPIVSHQEEAEAAYTPASSPTVTITSASNIASVDITPTNAAGTFVSSSTTSGSEVTFGVTTDNLTGYTLAVAARSGDTSGQLTNASYGDTIDSISTVTTETDFRTGAASTYTNKWGIKPSKYNSTLNTNGDFLPAPTTSELVLDTTNSPNPTTANTYTIGLGARVDYTKPVGTYTNTYVLQAVGNQIDYTITYTDTSPDTATVSSTLPGADGANNVEAAGFTLSSTVPTRTGYTFNKWCDGTVTHVASGDSTCSGTTYAAGENYTFSSLSTSSMNSATLVAMWNVNTYSLTANFTANTGVSSVKVCTVAGNCSGDNLKGTISTTGGSVSGLAYGKTYYLYPTFAASGYELYSWAKTSSTGTLSSTSAVNPTFTMGAGNGVVTTTGRLYMQNIASSLCTTTARTVYDKRDQQTYTIQKLADGKCWMMTNLNLGATALTTNLTSANTNITTTVTAATFNSWNTKLPNVDGSSVTIATYVVSTADINPDGRVTDPVTNTPYGILYNVCAASGHTYCYEPGKTSTGDHHGNITYDICPASWRLPIGEEFANLYSQSAYNTYAKMRAPISSGGAAFTLSGYWHQSNFTTVPGRGRYGKFLASTIPDGNDKQTFGLNMDDETPRVRANYYTNLSRDDGHTIRCVLK